MTDKERLVELLSEAEDEYLAKVSDAATQEERYKIVMDAYGFYADHLIANGVVVQKQGEWILGYVEPGYFTPGGNRPWVCSECGQVVSWSLDKPKEGYCSNCGAKMVKEDK